MLKAFKPSNRTHSETFSPLLGETTRGLETFSSPHSFNRAVAVYCIVYSAPVLLFRLIVSTAYSPLTARSSNLTPSKTSTRPTEITRRSDCLRAGGRCYVSDRSKFFFQESRLLGYKNPVRTSQETHYFSTTQSSRLMLCKIWGFHGSDYEESRLLGYKNRVRTSQETPYVSTTESSRLMLCKIWGFHGSDYEEWCLLGCYAVWLL
jgi:hypothetical protein